MPLVLYGARQIGKTWVLQKFGKNFYKRIDFCKLNFDLELYKVIYTPYVLYISDAKDNDSKIIDYIFKIYNNILGEKRVRKNCKVIH